MKRYQLISVEPMTASSVLLTLKGKRSKDNITFYPGQYAAIGFKKGARPSPMRCFSIIHVPGNEDLVQFGMRVEGNFTQTISQLQPGAKVFLEGPFGNFVIDHEQDRNIVMMAGGIGITPFMSMIRTATAYRSPKPMVLLYSCRSQHDIPFYEELLELERRNPKFHAVFFITDGKVDKTMAGRFMAGRISEEALQQMTQQRFNAFTYFICGPKSFMRGMEETLVANNTSPTRIVTEDFTASSPATAASAPAFSIPRWTYGLTAASLVLGTGFIMGLDLVRAVPRLSQAHLVNSASAAPSAPSQSPSGSTTTPPDPSSSTSIDTSPSSGASSSGGSSSAGSSYSSTPAPQYQQPQSYYQPPMTSVS